MTQEESIIKQRLIELVGKNVKVVFDSKRNSCERNNESRVSGIAIRDDFSSRVVLFLYKEDNIELWSKAIYEAEEAHEQRFQDREHEYKSPNFYKAVSAYISDLQQNA